MSNQMSKTMRDEILMNDLGWLGDITFHRVGGKIMLGDADLPFTVSHVMGEKEFVRHWLLQFAVGNSVGNGLSYFDRVKWMEMSEGGARSVAVVTDEEKPQLLMIVPPLISHNMSAREEYILRRASILINNSSKDNFSKNNPGANLKVAEKLEEVLKEVKPRTLTDLVLPEFFARHKINPAVERQLYYIRDTIREKGGTTNEQIERARVILYRDHAGQPHPKEDVEFIHYLAHGRYVFQQPVDENAKPSQGLSQPTQTPESDDPLSC